MNNQRTGKTFEPVSDRWAFFLNGIILLFLIPVGLWIGQKVKPFLGWDELYRYVWYGIEKHRFGFMEVVGPLFDWFDNGVVTVVLLRFLRNVWPNHPDMALFFGKWFFAGFVWLSYHFFLRTIFDGDRNKKLRRFLLVGALFSPALWMQWNILMNEGVTLGFAFLWWAIILRSPHFFRWSGVALGSIVAALFLFASFQLYFAWSVSLFCSLFLMALLARFTRPYRLFLLNHMTFVLGGLVIWNIFRIFQPWGMKWQQIFGHLQESRNSYAALTAGLEQWEYWLYGIRGFNWIVFPSSILLVSSLVFGGFCFFWKRKYILSKINPRMMAVAITAFLQIPIYAFGYLGNLQDRYRFHSQMFLLVTVLVITFWFGEFVLLKMSGPHPLAAAPSGNSEKKKGRIKWRPILAVGFGFFTGVCGFEYAVTWKEFPCLANSQHYGEYLYDSGQCDQIPRVFRYQNGSLMDRYPGRRLNPQLPLPDFYEWKERVVQLLEKDRAIETSRNNPNFFLQRSVEYWYLLKFGEYAPKASSSLTGKGIQWIRLSLPATSRWISTPYRDLEGRSDEHADQESRGLRENFNWIVKDSKRSADFVFEFLTSRPLGTP